MNNLALCGLWAGYPEQLTIPSYKPVPMKAVMLINVLEWHKGWAVGAPMDDQVFLRAKVVKEVEGEPLPREFRIIMPKRRYVFRPSTCYISSKDKPNIIEMSGDVYGPSPLSRQEVPESVFDGLPVHDGVFSVPEPDTVPKMFMGLEDRFKAGYKTVNELRAEQGLLPLVGMGELPTNLPKEIVPQLSEEAIAALKKALF